MDYSTWSLEDLQARFVESGGELTVLANERQALLAEMNVRETRATASARVSALSDQEKDALREVLGPKTNAVVEEGSIVVVRP